jgi:hypothetical protein
VWNAIKISFRETALAWLGKTDSFAKFNNPTLDLTLSAALVLTASTHNKML